MDNEHLPLTGTYRVSFDIRLSDVDDLALDDIIQAIASGFDGTPVIQKIANLSVDKANQVLQVGDKVRLTVPLEVTAEVKTSGRLLVVGALESEMAESIGEYTFHLPCCTAHVNRITAQGIELADFDGMTVLIDDCGENRVAFLRTLTVDDSFVEKI